MAGSFDTPDQDISSMNSFWDFREYVRTVKRVDAANKLCSELALMIQERADIEKAFATNLKKWSIRWNSFLNTGLEYASGASQWKGLFQEAEEVANAHQSIRDVLMEEIHTRVKFWQKEHFHKTTLPPQTLKESKQFEQDFEQAQKAWTKRLKKVAHCKKDFHQACKMERSLQVQLQNAKNDPSGNSEQTARYDERVKKVQDKLTKTEKEKERTHSLYQNALSDLDADNPRYLEDMTKVFNRTQEFERERILEFKEVFSTLLQSLNVTKKINYDEVYDRLEQSIDQVDPDADLAWWSSHHGVDMPAVEAHFEEYSPEPTTLAGAKRRTQVADTNNSVTLTNITPTVTPAPVVPENHHKPDTATNGHKADKPTPFDDSARNTPTTTQQFPSVSAESGQNEELLNDADYYSSATYDDGRPGVSVKALYDYVGQEDDELTLKADRDRKMNASPGDEFEQLEDADDQGWCKGRKDGHAGLYPANYAEPI